MAHVRKQIRDAVVTALTGLPITGTSVYAGRAYPIPAAPSLVVMTWPDDPLDVQEESEAGCIRAHALTIEVHGHFSNGDDDNLDQIAVEVEEAIYADTTLGGLVQYIEPGVQDAGRDADGQKMAGVVIMQWRAIYLAAEGSPEVAL